MKSNECKKTPLPVEKEKPQMEIGIIVLLWGMLSFLVMAQYIEACKGISWKRQLIVSIIFVVGSPILALASILTTILGCLLPEGWDDE